MFSASLVTARTKVSSAEWQILEIKNEELRAKVQQLAVELEQVLAEKAELEQELDKAKSVNNQLETENKRLKTELKELKQTPFQSRCRKTSSTVSDSATDTAPPKKRCGRPKGHQGSGRRKPDRVDYTEFVSVGDHCPDCDNSFTGTGVERQRTVEDIELVRPTVVVRYVIERRWCPVCQTYKEHPVTAALPSHRLGLNLMLFVVYQKVALGLSYGKIKKELAIYFDLQVSRATLVNIVAEVAQLFGPAYARLIKLMRQQKALHIDETSWRVNGQGHWLWIFINDLVALYVLSHSRGSKVPKALLGSEFEGVVISDFFSAYSPLEVEKAKCWAHLLRDSHALTKGQPPPDSERLQFHQHLHQLFLDMALAIEQAQADPDEREVVYQDMRTNLQNFAQQDWSDADCQRLAARILKHLDELVLWLRNPAVSPDNNAAERGLRPAVVTRKTSFGSRSKRGAQAFARLLSLIRTWEGQELDFFDTAKDILSGHSEN
jgi:transposase